MTNGSRITFFQAILSDWALRNSAEILWESPWGHIGLLTFQNKKSVWCTPHSLLINTTGAQKICDDKAYTDFFLKKYGYKTIPQTQAFFSDSYAEQHLLKNRSLNDALIYTKEIGFPVVVKPNSASQGELVTVAHDISQTEIALQNIFSAHNIAVVQKYIQGNDYRIVFSDHEFICAYQRIPLQIYGNGKDTIENLLQQRFADWDQTGRDIKLNLYDNRIDQKLSQSQKTRHSILNHGESLFLLDNANLSTGGSAVDVTNIIHADYKNIGLAITKQFHIRLCGMDMITLSDITKPLKDYVIVELNASPGLSHYATLGASAKKRVIAMYENLLTRLSHE